MNTSKLAPLGLAVAAALAFGTARAETVNTSDGNFFVVESVPPLGTALHYVAGGNGLIGTSGSWPTFADTAANRAFAVEHADHNWMQFDTLSPTGSTAILMSSAVAVNSLFAVGLRPRPRRAV